MIQPPGFWWDAGGGLPARALAPAAALYGAVSGRRLRRGSRVEAGLPVLCVGNFTVGGAGKTPTALALGRAAIEAGIKVGYLSRGYGRDGTAPLLVDPKHHGAAQAGDEPLLLAALAPTVVSADRAAGAALLRAAAAPDLLIMDDGFQSARLAIDLALLVVDGRRGLGNGRVLPAGPLRAPLDLQFSHADAVLVVGDGAAGEAAAARAAAAGLSVERARIAAEAARSWAGRRVLAFCGIADPEKFRRSLAEVGASLAGLRAFPDHHPFTRGQLADLQREAEAVGAVLATTAKDHARIRGSGARAAEFLRAVHVLEIEMRFVDREAPRRLVEAAMARFSARRRSPSPA
ncbi:tetraacyldisaccharide 4'-kinase [Antarcticirhabdus aurantiaca]|uniref:Tetraacyldisaccharide 4'-kinase n=1 Tax=Antarcticirhabdus aurantiaca TaxID=2606717 RepID=A0ACD4NLV5_9HYPH|nr:tetraacyldisaccharide 4'-kinase [Antarcticirhabdus aurantiaca]WAJ27695.1 tetraacyldisaccharide 4'-kinase [Jeongeuplla avenae]